MDLGGVLLAACGLSLLCVGLLVVGAVLAGRSFLIPVIGPIIGTMTQQDAVDDDEYVPRKRSPRRPRIGRSSSTGFSAQGADPLDFDAAVARHRQGPSSPSGGQGSGTAPMKRHGLGSTLGDSPAPPLRGGGLRGRSSDRNQGELHNYLEGEDEEDDFL